MYIVIHCSLRTEACAHISMDFNPAALLLLVLPVVVIPHYNRCELRGERRTPSKRRVRPVTRQLWQRTGCILPVAEKTTADMPATRAGADR